MCTCKNKHECALAKIGADAAETEPFENLRKSSFPRCNGGDWSPSSKPRFWTTLHLLRPGIISGPCFERFEEWFKCGSRKKGAESENIFGNIEYRAIEPMLHCEQMHRYPGLLLIREGKGGLGVYLSEARSRPYQYRPFCN